MDKKLYEYLKKAIDNEASATVGTLCKRVEVLTDKELEKLSVKQLRTLFKNLSKEIVYERSRVLKSIVKLLLQHENQSNNK